MTHKPNITDPEAASETRTKGRRRVPLDIDLNTPPGPFMEPLLTDIEDIPAAPEFKFPEDIWRSGGRERAVFGSCDVEMSIHQARLRKLVVHSPLFQGVIRACPTKADEDRLMKAYDRKQAAKGNQ